MAACLLLTDEAGDDLLGDGRLSGRGFGCLLCGARCLRGGALGSLLGWVHDVHAALRLAQAGVGVRGCEAGSPG